ncbi:hypothetical protein DICVIV_04757 [Dictyocaulus viviparus]|uniref:Uncharacterized protein n=1 Tax=Dictyocaulus viviparus TaxID=29172 RepID=A0A0D8XZ40_DICVI|nr:hypothetical protein DICVIV_04757 [Dictyocaulus viviparus]
MERLGQFPLCVPLLQALRPSLPPWLPLSLHPIPPPIQSILPPPSTHSATDSASITIADEEEHSIQSETTDEAVNSQFEVASPTSPSDQPTNETLSRPASADSSIQSEVNTK